MKRNKCFNVNRFALLCRHNILMNYKRSLSFVIVSSAVVYFVLLLTITGMQGKFIGDIYRSLLYIIMVVFGFLTPVNAFSSAKNKSSLTSYLLLPASHLEKYMVMFITYILFLFPFLFAMYWLNTILASSTILMLDLKAAENIVPFNFSILFGNKNIGFVYKQAISILSIILWAFAGSFFFNKHKALKTLLVGVGFIIGDWLMKGVYSHLFFPNKTKGFASLPAEYNSYFDLTNIQWHFYVTTLIGIVLFVFLAYHKLKEKEI